MAVLNNLPAPRLPRRPLATILALCLGVFAGASSSPAQSTPSSEYQVKAVFLFNFTGFVEWPATAFADAKAPLVIGILGQDPFENSLAEAVRDEQVNNRPLLIQHYTRVDEIKACHVLFISRSEAGRLDRVLTSLRGRAILTVADLDDFARRGGMIQLVTEKNKVRLRINIEAAKSAGLSISSKLLRPAEIVASGKN